MKKLISFIASLSALALISSPSFADSIYIDHSGRDGTNGSSGDAGRSGDDGRNGSSWGTRHGSPGSDGSDGQDGGNGSDGSDADAINAHLQIDSDRIVELRVGNRTEKKAADGLESIHLQARGGDGGNGASGGRGGDGGNGGAGADASAENPAGNGGSGGRGGKGGQGGDAGEPGDGNEIIVKVPEDQSYLLWLVNTENRGGRSGYAGQGGMGGSRGDGGRGGSFYTSENRNYEAGIPGLGGTEGTRGKDGRSSGRSIGREGRTKLVLVSAQGERSYDRYFNVVADRIEIEESSADGILEPGEEVSLLSITLSNRSEMPTPKGLGLKLQGLGFKSAKAQTDELQIAEDLAAGASKTLRFAAGEMTLKMPETLGATPFKPYLNFNGLKRYITLQFENLKTAYPLWMNGRAWDVHIPNRNLHDITIEFANLSKADLGSASASKRNILFELKPKTSDSSFLVQQGGVDSKLAQELIVPIELFKAESKAPIGIRVQLREDRPLYSISEYEASLYLSPLGKTANDKERMLVGRQQIKFISELEANQAINYQKDISAHKLYVKYQGGDFDLVKSISMSRQPSSDRIRLQYKVKAMGGTSPFYEIALKDIPNLLPSLTANQDLSNNELWILFTNHLKPLSNSKTSWQFEWVSFQK